MKYEFNLYANVFLCYTICYVNVLYIYTHIYINMLCYVMYIPLLFISSHKHNNRHKK